MQCSSFFPLLLLLLLMFSYYLLGDARVVWCLPLDDRQSSIQFSCVFLPSFCGCGSFHSFGERILMSTMNMNQFMNPLFISYTAVPSSSRRSSRDEKGNCACTYASFDGCRDFFQLTTTLRATIEFFQFGRNKISKNALEMMSRHFQLFSHEIIRRVAKARWLKDTVAQLSTVETRCALAGGGVRYIADQSAICDDMYYYR